MDKHKFVFQAIVTDTTEAKFELTKDSVMDFSTHLKFKSKHTFINGKFHHKSPAWIDVISQEPQRLTQEQLELILSALTPEQKKLYIQYQESNKVFIKDLDNNINNSEL